MKNFLIYICIDSKGYRVVKENEEMIEPLSPYYAEFGQALFILNCYLEYK